MGVKPKAPVIVTPPLPATPDPSVEQAAMPAPTPQPNPALGQTSRRGPAALAASQGMNNTVLTGPRGLPGLVTETRRSSLLGL
jgi:hypothetical protein